MVEIEQQYVFQKYKKNNWKDNFEQYLLDKLAATVFGMLQVSKVVAPTSQQALILRCVSLYLECKQTVLWRREFASMLRIKQGTLHLKISLFTFSKEFSTATKCDQKCVQQDRILQSLCPNVRRCTGGETIYNFYIRITQTIQLESNHHQV